MSTHVTVSCTDTLLTREGADPPVTCHTSLPATFVATDTVAMVSWQVSGMCQYFMVLQHGLVPRVMC